jgi:hypothetical protein
VVGEDKDEHLPLPDGLALMGLGDAIAPGELGLGVVGSADGLLEAF